MTNTQGMSVEQLKARIAELEAAKVRALTMKVSEKGAISVYGLGRFPVTLYRSQWERLTTNGFLGEMREFIKANADKLTTKE